MFYLGVDLSGVTLKSCGFCFRRIYVDLYVPFTGSSLTDSLLQKIAVPFGLLLLPALEAPLLPLITGS